MGKRTRMGAGRDAGPTRRSWVESSGAGLLIVTGTSIAGCRLVPAPELQVGTPRSHISQVEDRDRVAVTVSIPVRASPEGATFRLDRGGREVTFDVAPSAALPGGVDLVDESAAYATTVAYEIVASFPTGDKVKKAVSVSLVRTLLAFPRLAPVEKGPTPKFAWDALGLESATFQLDVAPESAAGYSLVFPKGTSSYQWGEPASSSAGNQLIYPRSLVAGVKYSAKLTATAGPPERQEQMVSKPLTFVP